MYSLSRNKYRHLSPNAIRLLNKLLQVENIIQGSCNFELIDCTFRTQRRGNSADRMELKVQSPRIVFTSKLEV